jgi:DNA helicase-2/ATP-dependent DNA helicase PcrA
VTALARLGAADEAEIAAELERDQTISGRERAAAARADAASKSRKRDRPVPSLAAGDRVTHDSFGLGTVVSVEGEADRAVASIDFGSDGVKRLLLRYAPVEKL